MIRKSKEQRIADVQSALPRWEAAGRTREVTFMRDMVARLQGDKGLSPRQRTWLDELSAAAPPLRRRRTCPSSPGATPPFRTPPPGTPDG